MPDTETPEQRWLRLVGEGTHVHINGRKCETEAQVRAAIASIPAPEPERCTPDDHRHDDQVQGGEGTGE